MIDLLIRKKSIRFFFLIPSLKFLDPAKRMEEERMLGFSRALFFTEEVVGAA